VDADSTSGKDSKMNPPPQNPSAGFGDGSMQVISRTEGQFVRVPNLSTADYSIKIGLTLYKVQQNIYLLDFQKMTGDAFSFMTLCANIITELKTLSAASKQAQQQQAMYMAAQQQAQQEAVAAQQAAATTLTTTGQAPSGTFTPPRG
jgi:Kinase associated domain 1